MKIEIAFGALSDKLLDQLSAQGLMADLEDIKLWQLDVDALNRLAIRGYVSESVAARARQKIMKRITHGVRFGGSRCG